MNCTELRPEIEATHSETPTSFQGLDGRWSHRGARKHSDKSRGTELKQQCFNLETEGSGLLSDEIHGRAYPRDFGEQEVSHPGGN